MKYMELTGLDDQPVLVALEHVVTVRPVSEDEARPKARTEIEVVTGAFWVQEDYPSIHFKIVVGNAV